MGERWVRLVAAFVVSCYLKVWWVVIPACVGMQIAMYRSFMGLQTAVGIAIAVGVVMFLVMLWLDARHPG